MASPLKWKIPIPIPPQYGIVPIPYWGEIGMGFSSLSGEATKGGKKFLHESRKAHYIFPKNGLAGVVKKNSTMSGEATNGGIFFYHNC